MFARDALVLKYGEASRHHTIPVIDVADYLVGAPAALAAAARQVRDALTTVGFFVLTGHDVPQTLIDETFAEAQRLHDLPMAKKAALKLNDTTTATWRWAATRCGRRR